MKHAKIIWIFAVIATLCTAGLVVGATQRYTFSPAGNFPGAAQTTPLALTSAHIVGYYYNSTVEHGYIQTGTQFIDPVPPNSGVTYFSGINRHGLAVGGFCVANQCSPLQAQHGYTYDFATGAIVTFDDPLAGQSTVPFGINDAGDIVGGYCGTTSLYCPRSFGIPPDHGFLLSKGVFITLDYPDPKSLGTALTAINNPGTIVGYYLTDQISHGIMYKNGVFSLVDFPGAMYTQPNGINDLGVVSGSFQNPDLSVHGFTYQNGRFTQVDVPPQLGVNTGLAGIDNAGVMVGSYDASHGLVPNFKATPKHSAVVQAQ